MAGQRKGGAEDGGAVEWVGLTLQRALAVPGHVRIVGDEWDLGSISFNQTALAISGQPQTVRTPIDLNDI